MQRREFVQLASGAALMAPVAAYAQQKAVPVVGILNTLPAPSPATATTWKPYLDALRQGLSESGYVEGQNVALQWRFAEGHYERLPALAADLVARKVNVIETNGFVGAQAAKNATSTVPIVFSAVGDPVGDGLIASLARPGGNITGVTDFALQLAPKFLDLLSDLVPGVSRIGLLVNPAIPSPAELFIQNVGEGARTKGLNLAVEKASTEAEIDAAFAALAQAKTDALIVAGDAFFLSKNDRIVALAARYAIPTIFYNVLFPRRGGLIAYGVDEVDVFGGAFVCVGKILNGANPAEMPVERPTRFKLVINLRTAKELGLTVPQSILGSADEVIE
jgi:putative tryptophan/tyrosine transport system substrate-binding protein